MSKNIKNAPLPTFSDIDEKVERTASVYGALGELKQLLKRSSSQNRDNQNRGIQTVARAAMKLKTDRRSLKQYIGDMGEDVSYKKYRTFGECLRLVFGQICGDGRNGKIKAARRVRAVLHLVEDRNVSIGSLAQALADEGGITGVIKQRANASAGRAVREKTGAGGFVGTSRFKFTFKQMVDAANPDTGKGVLKIAYKLDKAGDLAAGKAKIKPVETSSSSRADLPPINTQASRRRFGPNNEKTAGTKTASTTPQARMLVLTRSKLRSAR